MKKIAQGAEAIIYDDGDVVKDRISKNYRIKEIDEPLRKFRTKREAKVMRKLDEMGVRVPKLLKVDKTVIVMEKISGEKLKEFINKENCGSYFRQLGVMVAKMHENDIVHGDLTTSNIMIGEDLVIIDFGLSFFSAKVEDKAVDVHLFKETIQATHPELWEKLWKSFLKGYSPKNKKEIIERLKVVEERGRYKKSKK